jgi:hypothetical protein
MMSSANMGKARWGSDAADTCLGRRSSVRGKHLLFHDDGKAFRTQVTS